MIEEASRRRPGWIEGVPIQLEDGQSWHFPRPVIEFRIRPGGAVRASAPVETSRRFGDRFWSLHEGLMAAIRGDDFAALLSAYINLAADLLIRNYDLSGDEIVEMMPWIPGDEVNMAMWRSVVDVGLGAGPKPSAAG